MEYINIILLPKQGKKEYFGAASYSDFTIHKDEERKKDILNSSRNEKIGQNQVLIQLVGGV